MALMAFLNLYTVEWSSSSGAVDYSNALAVAFLVLAVVAPFLLVHHYSRNWHRVTEPRFEKKYGTFVNGLKIWKSKELKWSLLIVPAFFLFRRAVFIFCVFYLKS